MLVKRAAGLGLGALVASFALACGCGSEERAGPAGTGGVADGGGTGGTGAGGGGTGGGLGASGGAPGGGAGGTGGGCPGGSPPSDAPPDWELYTGYCDCPIWIPGKQGKMPDPVEWEPCPSPGPLVASCKRMKTPWTKTTALSHAFYPVFWFDKANGRAVLQFARTYLDDDKSNKRRLRLVADLDGPILNAFFEDSTSCTLSEQSVQGGRYAFGVTPTTPPPKPEQIEGVVAGEIGKPVPGTGLASHVENLYANWRASSGWLIRWQSGLTGRHWGSDQVVQIQKASLDPEGELPYGPRAVGDTVFWEVGGQTKHGVVSWTEASGQQNLIRWLGDYTQGAGNFNTDGVDMVWSHGTGKAPSASKYPTVSIKTAPFTTDPAVRKAKEKRLRSDPGQLGVTPFGVGCGYASHTFDDDTTNSVDLLVVRLSDGVSWVVKAPPVSTGVMFMNALGTSCSDVFTQVQFPDEANAIVRIPLSALGPAIPPD
ncbi:MAG: hypothetical protein L6Q84_26805 [Polyangiaceae bacterium]|nr:hypothetical protein [Polyangiaceae bacterium]